MTREDAFRWWFTTPNEDLAWGLEAELKAALGVCSVPRGACHATWRRVTGPPDQLLYAGIPALVHWARGLVATHVEAGQLPMSDPFYPGAYYLEVRGVKDRRR
jgi:hypothetical protein